MRENSPSADGIFFGLEVTRRCNLQCPHCFTGSTSAAHPGPTRAALRDLFAQLVEVGAERIAFSGGEPLVRTDLEVILREGRALGLKGYHLVTNGFRATPELARRLKQAGLVSVQVSIDGVDRSDHCRLRDCPPAAFYRALSAVRAYREAGVGVDVATILAGPNLQRAPEMVLLCKALGARRLRYCSFVPTGRAANGQIQDRYDADPDQVDAFLGYLRSVSSSKQRFGVVVDHGVGPWDEKGHFQCMAGRKVAYITAEGDLYPCPTLMHEPFKVGNVFQTKLAELIASPALHRVRRIKRRELTEPCRSCTHRGCSGGCRGTAYARTGNVLAAPATCNVRRRDAARSITGAAAAESVGSGSSSPACTPTGERDRVG